MNRSKFFVTLLSSAIILCLLYFQFTTWRSGWLGWILFVLYILSVGDNWKKVFSRTFGLSTSSWLNRVFSWLTVFLLLSFASSILIISYLLSPLSYFYIYLFVALFSCLLPPLLSKKKVNIAISENSDDQRNFILFKFNWLWLCAYLLIWVLGFYLLASGISDSTAFSPWQSINRFYLPVFFVLTLFSGVFLFAKFKTKTILFILILQSILLSSYLPLSREMPWGGDVWRHLAVENRLQAGESVLPVLFGPEVGWREVAGVNLPEVFLSPQKFAYSQLWGISVLISETLRVDLITVNHWLLPVLWSITIPFILFRIGWLIFGSRRSGLWLAWLSFLAFPFQALGALTLPVSLGYLTFFFVFMLWLQYWRDRGRSQRRYAVLFSLLMVFGYPLHFILIWIAVILSHITYLLSRNIEHGTWNKSRKVLITYTVFIFSLVAIPLIEIVSGYGQLNFANWFVNLKQLAGQFSGWFYASMIRPHDILTGNVWFNHTPDYAFVENVFNSWRWWLMPVMIIFIILFIYSFINIWFRRSERWWLILLNLTGVIVGGYLLSWIFLSGDHLLTRRLDLMFVFLWMVFLIYILSKWLSRWQARRWIVRAVVLLIVFGLSWFGVMTYASGPDMRVVSGGEYGVAKNVWGGLSLKSIFQAPEDQKIERLKDYASCVLADTWVLLPLEGLSAGKIVGGGFPIDYQFGQKERVELFNKFAVNPEAQDLEKMKFLTGSADCLIIYPESQLDSEIVNRISEIVGLKPEKVSGFLVWGGGK